MAALGANLALAHFQVCADNHDHLEITDWEARSECFIRFGSVALQSNNLLILARILVVVLPVRVIFFVGLSTLAAHDAPARLEEER